MKTDTRTTPHQGPRVAAAPAPATPQPATPAAAPTPPDSASIEADLQAIAREEEALRQRREARRNEYWTLSLAHLSRTIEQLVSFGFDRADIGRALGFAATSKPATSAKKGSGGGPKTYDGWFALSRTALIQSYIKNHPDLAATLKSSGVPRDQFASHIPAADLKVIDDKARQKALAKCPQPAPSDKVPSEVSSK